MDERLIFPYRQRTETTEAWGANLRARAVSPFGGSRRGALGSPLVVGQRRSDASGQPAAEVVFRGQAFEPVPQANPRGVGARRDDGGLTARIR